MFRAYCQMYNPALLPPRVHKFKISFVMYKCINAKRRLSTYQTKRKVNLLSHSVNIENFT